MAFWNRPKRAEVQASSPYDAEGQASRSGYKNHTRSTYNNYKSWETQLQAIEAKSRSEADYGNSIVSTILDYRAGWIFSNRAEYTADGEREQAWLKEFVRINGLDTVRPTLWGRLGEKQGHVILVLTTVITEGGARQVRLEPLKYLDLQYSVRKINDEIAQVYWSPDMVGGMVGAQVVVNPDRFEVVMLSEDSVYDDNNNKIRTPTVLGSVLTQCDDYDRAFRDVRMVHELYAKPTMQIKVKSPGFMRQIIKYLTGGTSTNAQAWKMGDYLVLAEDGEMQYRQADMQGAESMRMEARALLQQISGRTGVPIHLLGHAEIVGGGRATAETFVEGIGVMTRYKREAWESGMEMAIKKSMVLYNQMNGTALNPETIEVVIPEVSLAQAEHRFHIAQQMFQDGVLSERTYLQNSPIIGNADEELERIAEQSENRMGRLSESFAAMLPDANQEQVA